MAQHAAKGARFQAVTANRLSDGEVVYFRADNRWVERFTEADVADGTEAAEALLARAMPDMFEAHVLEPICSKCWKMAAFTNRPACARPFVPPDRPCGSTSANKQK